MWNAFSVPISPGALHRLADGDERRHVRVLRAERLRDHRADVRHRHRLRRDVAGVPVVLMARVQDEAEVGRHERCGSPRRDPSRCAIRSSPCVNLMWSTAVSIAGNVLSTCSTAHARRERRVALRIERLGLRHAAGHPQHDDGVGGRGASAALRLASAAACRQRCGSRPASARQRRRRGQRPMNSAPRASAARRSSRCSRRGCPVRSASCDASVDELELRLHHHRPQQIRQSFRRRPIAGRAGSRTPPREPALGRVGARPERMPEARGRSRAATSSDRRRRRQRRRRRGGSRRSMFGSVSKTKKRSCGFSVEPMSPRVLEPDAPRNRVKPAGDVVDQHRRILHAHAVTVVSGTRTGRCRTQAGAVERRQRRRAARSPTARRAPPAPRPAAPSRRRSTRSSCTTSQSRARVRDVDVERCWTSATRPATARL